MAPKRTRQKTLEHEIEIGPFQLRLMLGEFWETDILYHTHSFLSNCDCGYKELVRYKSYLNGLNDVVLRGHCRSCGVPVSKYIETGQRKGIGQVAERIKKLNGD